MYSFALSGASLITLQLLTAEASVSDPSQNSPKTILLTNGRPGLSVVDAPRARGFLER
jgi:hypothetical protein